MMAAQIQKTVLFFEWSNSNGKRLVIILYNQCHGQILLQHLHIINMSIPALIQLALSLLPIVTTEVGKFIAWIDSLIAAAKQSGEWTPDQEAAYRAALFAKTNDPAYKQDA